MHKSHEHNVMTEPQVGCASVPRHGIVASSDDVFKQRHRVSESPFFATLMTSEFGDASEVLGNSHPVKLVRGVYGWNDVRKLLNDRINKYKTKTERTK